MFKVEIYKGYGRNVSRKLGKVYGWNDEYEYDEFIKDNADKVETFTADKVAIGYKRIYIHAIDEQTGEARDVIFFRKALDEDHNTIYTNIAVDGLGLVNHGYFFKRARAGYDEVNGFAKENYYV